MNFPKVGFSPSPTWTLNGPPVAGRPRSSLPSQSSDCESEFLRSGSGAFGPRTPATRWRTVWPWASTIDTAQSVDADAANSILRSWTSGFWVKVWRSRATISVFITPNQSCTPGGCRKLKSGVQNPGALVYGFWTRFVKPLKFEKGSLYMRLLLIAALLQAAAPQDVILSTDFEDESWK